MQRTRNEILGDLHFVAKVETILKKYIGKEETPLAKLDMSVELFTLGEAYPSKYPLMMKIIQPNEYHDKKYDWESK